MSAIHPTAIIDPAADVHGEAVIGPWCVIGPRVEIGARTELLNHVSIQCDTTIGVENRVYPYAVLGADPQDKKFEGERTTLELGDGNQVREHVTLHRGTANGGGRTVIGNNNLIMVGAHVAHDCYVGDDNVIANQVMLAGHVVIEDGVGIGGGAGVHHFVTIGQCAFVGGLARVARDVPPFMIAEGHPADVRGVNLIALTRRGFQESDIDVIKEAYRQLFRENGGAMADRASAVRSAHGDHPAIVELCDAIEASAAGRHGRAQEARRIDDKWSAPAPQAC